MINVRFIITSPGEEDRVFARWTMSAAPLQGEIVTLAEVSFIVIDRQWTIENDGAVHLALRIRALAERRVQ